MSARTAPRAVAGRPPAARADSGAVVQAESLTKRFGDVVAVDDLSFALERGTVTGFLGPNGAGKTTTLRMLLHLVQPTAGRALVLGGRYEDLERPADPRRRGLEAADFHPGPLGSRPPVRARARARPTPAATAASAVASGRRGSGSMRFSSSSS